MLTDDIKRAYGDMRDAERRVADYILDEPARVTQMSMAELSAATGTSDATVMRMCKRVGQKGFYQLKINLAIESTGDTPKASAGTRDGHPDIVTLVDGIAANVARLSQDISKDELLRAVDEIAGARTVFTFGWGNTNAVAEDLALRLLRYGINTFTSTSMEYTLRSIALADEQDVLVVFSRSGEATMAAECCKLAKVNGLTVVVVTSDKKSTVAKYADVLLKVAPSDDLLGRWGESSHSYEIILNDLILYFLKDRTERYNLGTKTEAILGQFKS